MSKTHVTYAIVAVVVSTLAFVVFATKSTPAAALTDCDTTSAEMNAAENQMLLLVNGARATAGLAALKSSPGLNRAAAWKSADPSATGSGLSHTDSLGRDYLTRFRECGYGGGGGEDIAYGYGAAQATFDAWMGSPGHRANILGSYKMIGLGQVGSAWTADFGNFDDSGTSNPPATATSTRVPPTTPTPTSIATATSTPPALLGVNVPLSAGENLVTYVGPELPALVALRSVTAGVLVVVYEWEPGEQRWAKFSPGKPGYVNTFSTMKPGGVYSIQVSGGATWSY